MCVLDSGILFVVLHRQLDDKSGTLWYVILNPYGAMVVIDDGAHDGQSEAHSGFLCGEIRFE